MSFLEKSRRIYSTLWSLLTQKTYDDYDCLTDYCFGKNDTLEYIPGLKTEGACREYAYKCRMDAL